MTDRCSVTMTSSTKRRKRNITFHQNKTMLCLRRRSMDGRLGKLHPSPPFCPFPHSFHTLTSCPLFHSLNLFRLFLQTFSVFLAFLTSMGFPVLLISWLTSQGVSCSIFSVGDFARQYSQRLGLSEGVLRRTLWGDFYIDNKNKRVRANAQVGT